MYKIEILKFANFHNKKFFFIFLSKSTIENQSVFSMKFVFPIKNLNIVNFNKF